MFFLHIETDQFNPWTLQNYCDLQELKFIFNVNYVDKFVT